MKDFNSVREQDNTFVWHDGGLIFMCIGKAANSSIKAAVLETMGGVDPNVSVHYDERIEYIPNASIKGYGYQCVTFVRNPLDRLRSFWQDKIAHRDECNFEHLGLRPGMSFEATAAQVCALGAGVKDTHLARQVDLLTHKGERMFDRLFKYETLHEDWQQAQMMAMCYLPDLPHYNKSNPVPWTLPGEVLARLMVHYVEDYKRLGYS
jgi:hypothetical protein